MKLEAKNIEKMDYQQYFTHSLRQTFGMIRNNQREHKQFDEKQIQSLRKTRMLVKLRIDTVIAKLSGRDLTDEEKTRMNKKIASWGKVLNKIEDQIKVELI